MAIAVNRAAIEAARQEHDAESSQLRSFSTTSLKYGADAQLMSRLELRYNGRQFTGGEDDFVDLAEEEDLTASFGGDLSIVFTVRWDAWTPDSCLLDFGGEPACHNIRIRAEAGTLEFCVFHGSVPRWVRAECLTIGETSRFLCTAAITGHMKVFKDGDLVSENWGGYAPMDGFARTPLYIGRSAAGQPPRFNGLIEELLVFNALLTWDLLPEPPKSKVWYEFVDPPEDWDLSAESVLLPAPKGPTGTSWRLLRHLPQVFRLDTDDEHVADLSPARQGPIGCSICNADS